MIDDKASVELILKVQVPHMGIVKTLRTNTGHKVASLTEALMEKLETAEKQDFSQFGLHWYSETGPLWLSDNSYVRSYGLKNGDQLQYKQKPLIATGFAAATSTPASAAAALNSTKKASSPFLSSARLRTSSTPQIVLPAVPSLPSSPIIQSPKSPREGHRKTAKEALMKAFHFGDNKQAASQPPSPPSHPHQHRPISVSSPMPVARSFHSPPVAPPVVIPQTNDSLMQKSMSTPSPTQHRAHSATAPPKPISLMTDMIDDPSTSSRKHSPLPAQRSPPSPPSPLQPPPSLSRVPSFSNAPLPRMPSQLPPLYRAPSNGDTRHSCACEHSKTQACAHRGELDRMTAQVHKLTQRLELSECILTDTLQAIDDGEADLQAVKMYLQTALASLKREDVAQISFGK